VPIAVGAADVITPSFSQSTGTHDNFPRCHPRARKYVVAPRANQELSSICACHPANRRFGFFKCSQKYSTEFSDSVRPQRR